MENTNLEDTTSLSETNKTTEKEFPTPKTEDQWQNSIMTLQESQYFINIEQKDNEDIINIGAWQFCPGRTQKE